MYIYIYIYIHIYTYIHINHKHMYTIHINKSQQPRVGFKNLATSSFFQHLKVDLRQALDLRYIQDSANINAGWTRDESKPLRTEPTPIRAAPNLQT